jgi:hypothetical protein
MTIEAWLKCWNRCDSCAWGWLGRTILLDPKGVNGKGDGLAVFLSVYGQEKLAKNWSKRRSLKFTALDQRNASDSVVQGEASCPQFALSLAPIMW